MSVHRTISTAVLQRFVAARSRTALAEPVGSGDVSGAAAAIPDDGTAANREGCVATVTLAAETLIRNPTHTGTGTAATTRGAPPGTYQMVMKPRADAGKDIVVRVEP